MQPFEHQSKMSELGVSRLSRVHKVCWSYYYNSAEKVEIRCHRETRRSQVSTNEIWWAVLLSSFDEHLDGTT